MLAVEAFEATHVNPFPPLPAEHRYHLYRESQEVITLKTADGQKFSGLHLNRDHSTQPAIIIAGQWFCSAYDPDVRYGAFQQGQHNPHNQILYIDMVAHGSSDPSTRAQRYEAAHYRRASHLAGAQAEAATHRLIDSGTTEVALAGISAGGYMAAEMTLKMGAMGLSPLALIGVEIAGVDKRPSLSTAAAYLIDGHFGQKKYHKGAPNRKLDSALEEFKRMSAWIGEPGEKYSLMDIYEKDPWLLAFLIARSPLANNRAFDAISEAMESYPNLKAAFVCAALSKVSRLRKVKPGFERLEAAYPGRLSCYIWPHDSHAMGIGSQQPRFASFTHAVIESLSNFPSGGDLAK